MAGVVFGAAQCFPQANKNPPTPLKGAATVLNKGRGEGRLRLRLRSRSRARARKSKS